MTMVLVIEEDRSASEWLVRTLQTGGHAVEFTGNVETGLDRLRSLPRTDLVLVDLALPRTTGFQFLRELREERNDLPVMALSAQADEADRVQTFRLGADHLVVQPISATELLARVDCLIERSRARRAPPDGIPSFSSPYRFGDVEVNAATRQVRRGGTAVQLAPLELELLLALIRREGAAAARVELLKEVWGYESDVVSRTLDTHVANLRNKLEREPAVPRHILTVRKTGYRLQT
ncbi:MAG TPA: response regulator transcription factor [Gemmatimonadaceae bacterium]|nr:response regulator transcription factor [Gemmatimonadaceae bacterium]